MSSRGWSRTWMALLWAAGVTTAPLAASAQPAMGQQEPIPVARTLWDDADASEDKAFVRAIRLIESEEYDQAEAALREIEASDENTWLEAAGREHRHWLVDDYLGVIERRRAGDIETDQLFASARFRFHAQGAGLSLADQRALMTLFEQVLTKTALQLGKPYWNTDPPRTVFVHISRRFADDELGRSLVFFWDRPERSRRVAIHASMSRSPALDALIGRELCKVVAPHTCWPLAEGVAWQVGQRVSAGHRYRENLPTALPLRTLDDLLRWNPRAQGPMIQEALRLEDEPGGDLRSRRLWLEARVLGRRLVPLLQDVWGMQTFWDFYDATCGDPADFDVMDRATEHFASRRNLERLWMSTWEPDRRSPIE